MKLNGFKDAIALIIIVFTNRNCPGTIEANWKTTLLKILALIYNRVSEKKQNGDGGYNNRRWMHLKNDQNWF